MFKTLNFNDPMPLPKGWYWNGKPHTIGDHYKHELRLIFGNDKVNYLTPYQIMRIKRINHIDIVSRIKNILLLMGIKDVPKNT